MQENYIQDEVFHKIDFTQNPLPKGEYENCIFRTCNFADQNLSNFKFIDCVFEDCNLSLAKLNKTTLQNVSFKASKMLGLQFDTCNAFGLSFSFDGCQLNHSSFFKVKAKKTILRNTQLQETDFTESDFTGAMFDNCDLLLATFDHTLLEKADFRTSYNYSIDPETNKIKKAKFSLSGIAGLLQKYDIVIEE